MLTTGQPSRGATKVEDPYCDFDVNRTEGSPLPDSSPPHESLSSRMGHTFSKLFESVKGRFDSVAKQFCQYLSCTGPSLPNKSYHHHRHHRHIIIIIIIIIIFIIVVSITASTPQPSKRRKSDRVLHFCKINISSLWLACPHAQDQVVHCCYVPETSSILTNIIN